MIAAGSSAFAAKVVAFASASSLASRNEGRPIDARTVPAYGFWDGRFGLPRGTPSRSGEIRPSARTRSESLGLIRYVEDRATVSAA